MSAHHLHALGVYGYDDVEPVILAALVTGDPLLLIGRAGTGKTFLLNSLSEALSLEHRHYNASLIAFDDLVGFPYPEPNGAGIRYLETPATVWQAESVLIDEINRCKPEHQNRLFSLIQERRIQGLKLEKLRYRWAAMNPASIDQDGSESYSGCEPLDAALADRFAFLVVVGDWAELSEEDQRLVADPRGEGAIARDTSGVAELVEQARQRFAVSLAQPDASVIEYCRRIATILGEAGVRISPRRVRQLARNLLAAETVSKLPRERLWKLVLRWSLPQRAGSVPPNEETVHAAHRAAWEGVFAEGPERWLYDFHVEPCLAGKITKLLATCDTPDTGTFAVSQLLASEPPERAAVFALALYPLLLSLPNPPVGAEGIQDLGKLANQILDLRMEVTWLDRRRTPLRPADGLWEETHPKFSPYEELLRNLKGGRRERAEQLFTYLFLEGIKGLEGFDPATLEKQLHQCVSAVRNHLKSLPNAIAVA